VDGFLVAFLVSCLAAWLIYSLTYQLSGTMIGAMGFPATITLSGLRIGILTLQFSVSSFLALFGSSLLHLYMDSKILMRAKLCRL